MDVYVLVIVCPTIQPADDGPLLQSKSASGSSISVLGPLTLQNPVTYPSIRLDVDIIQETFALEDSVLLEALKKLEKLNTIQWLDDTRVILSENLEKAAGNTIDVYVEKIVQGGALVTVNEKWHARLNHYDYEGPRELLRKGSEFKVIGELYHDEGVFSLRVKQIV